MNLSQYASTMATYNAWMNERLYDLCAGLTDEARKRDMGAFFKSIHGTLNHLLLADRVWMGRFTGKPFAVRSLDQEIYADFAELRSQRSRTDGDITAWVASLDAKDFERDFSYTSIAKPQPRSAPLWLAITHFFNHQTHHRGQLTTLMKQLGIDPGVTDLIWMPDVTSSMRGTTRA